MSKKSKKVCMALNYIDYSLILAITECIAISAFASLVGISTSIASLVVELNTFEIKCISK